VHDVAYFGGSDDGSLIVILFEVSVSLFEVSVSIERINRYRSYRNYENGAGGAIRPDIVSDPSIEVCLCMSALSATNV
jgi:hypothetical protein